MSLGVTLEYLLVKLLQVCAFILDCLFYLPYYFIQEPRTVLELSNRTKATSLTSHPAGPYKCVEGSELTTTPDEDCSTLDELLQKAVMAHPDSKCLGTRYLIDATATDQTDNAGGSNTSSVLKYTLGDYKWMTFTEMMNNVDLLGEGLRSLGLEDRQELVLFSETRTEAMIAIQACFKYSFVLVTLQTSVPDDEVIYAIHQCEASLLITSERQLERWQRLTENPTRITTIVCLMDDVHKQTDEDECEKRFEKTRLSFNEAGIQLLTLREVMDKARAVHDDEVTPITTPLPTDRAAVMYTSGSSGQPKGVILSHLNIMAAVSGFIERLAIRSTDVYISYLPQSHIQGLTAELSALYVGAAIGYGRAATLLDRSKALADKVACDLHALRPTVMATVPAVLDKLYKSIWATIGNGSFLRRVLFKFAVEYKRNWMYRGANTPMINSFLLAHIKYQKLGGRIRMLLCGGAPLNPRTQEFLRICLNCPVLQGYGLTETTGVGSIVDPDDLSSGHAGSPLCCAYIKLVDWETGRYSCHDIPPRGEIWVGGPAVSLGYYKDPKRTDEDFHQSGYIKWYATGDIGRMRKDGTVVIIDRKKALVKLQNGEYVSLGKIEAVMKLSNLIENIYVVARPDQSYVAAIVIANQHQMMSVAEELQINGSWESLCQNEVITDIVHEDMRKQAKLVGLYNYETPRVIRLVPEKWTPDNGLLTESLKLNRSRLAYFYSDIINSLYPETRWEDNSKDSQYQL